MLEIISLIIGVVGTVAGLFSVYYAARAAKRSEALLRRLVVYPFRDLDLAYAKLTPAEQQVLGGLFGTFHRDSNRGTISQQEIAVANIEPQLLRFLATESWLQSDELRGKYYLNPDRVPYLTFLKESKGLSGGNEHGK